MSDVLTDTVTLVSQVTDVPITELSAGSRFDNLGNWSSFAALRLLVGIEDHFGVQLDLRDYLALETVGALADAVMAKGRRS